MDRNLSVCRRIIFYYPDDISLRITEMRLVPRTRYRPLRYNDTSPGCGNLFETGINRFILCGYQNSRIGAVLFSLQYFHEFPVHCPFLLRSASNPSNLPIFEFPSQVLFYKTRTPFRVIRGDLEMHNTRHEISIVCDSVQWCEKTHLVENFLMNSRSACVFRV